MAATCILDPEINSGQHTLKVFIDEKDLNGLILLREDSRNPQEKDLCFRCINFDDIEAVKLDLTEAFGNL